MELKDILFGAISILSLIIGYFFSKKKSEIEIDKLKSEIKQNEADTKHIIKETESDDIGVSIKVVEFYESQVLKLLDRVKELEMKIKSVEELQDKINELETLIEILKDNQCEMNDCPARKKYEESKLRFKNI